MRPRTDLARGESFTGFPPAGRLCLREQAEWPDAGLALTFLATKVSYRTWNGRADYIPGSSTRIFEAGRMLFPADDGPHGLPGLKGASLLVTILRR